LAEKSLADEAVRDAIISIISEDEQNSQEIKHVDDAAI